MPYRGKPAGNTFKLGCTGIVLLILTYFLHFKIEDIFLRLQGRCCVGVVIKEQRFHRGYPSTYKYQIVVDGRVYFGDSWITEATSIGDTIEVAYLNYFPRINRSVEGYFYGDFDCPDK